MKPKPPHATAAADRIPVSQKVAYGLGAVVTIVAVNSVVQLTNLVYIVGLGISAIWIGWAQAFPRLWDAIIDPFIGHLSDNSRSRYGRRIPFLVVGGLLIGIAFALLWRVPRDWSKEWMFGYFIVTSLFFYTVVPIYAIPHGALGMEMTDDYHEKTNLFAYASFIGNIGALTLPWVYYLANRPVFGGDTVNGIKWVCLGMAVLLTAAAMGCALLCKEGKLQQARAQARVPLVESFKITYRNRTFVGVVTAFVLLIVAFQLVMGFNNYITIFYLFAGNTEAASGIMGYNGTLWAVVGLAGAFPMAWLSRRQGKRRTVIFALALIIGGNLSKIFCYQPTLPFLTMIPTACLSLGMVIAFSLVNAMLADICDEDELATGIRREGVYFAVYNWWWKVAVSIATVASGYLQRYTGFVEGAPSQSDSTLYWLRVWEIGLPPALCLVSVGLLYRYPLTEERAYEIKALLKARQSAPVAATPAPTPGANVTGAT
ncbi:MAG TPA: MFS transporter [Opitutaceae bacterium]|jgi:GPH family glycoside/pentoside/hexuronide:cation symporter|nr:MFS transporter [Opitutaceae bacterium]